MLPRLEAVLQLAQQGLKLLPCDVNKRPWCAHGVHDATSDAGQIERWFNERPESLWGFQTGELVVLDVDADKLDDESRLWIEQHADELMATRVQHTRREGGRHYLYRRNRRDIRSMSDAELGGRRYRGIDTRGADGYAVAWGLEGKPASGEIQAAPDWLPERKRRDQVPAVVTSTSDRELAHLAAYLDKISADCDRDTWCKVGMAIHLESGASAAGFELWDTWSKTAPHRYDAAELARQWNSFRLDRPFAVGRGTLAQLADVRRETVVPGEFVRTALELWRDRKPVSWLLPPHLERGAIALMFGERDCYKSFLALRWCMQLARRGEPVLYLSAESRDSLWKRIEGLVIDHGLGDVEEALSRLPLYVVPQPLALSVADVAQQLHHELRRLKIAPAAVVVDTLSRYSPGLDVNASVDMGLMIEAAGHFVQRYDSTCVMVHHVGHAEKGRPRGSYVLMSDTDADFLVERPDPDQRRIVVTTGRLKDAECPAPVGFAAHVVELPHIGEDGAPLTTLVLREEGAVARPAPRPSGKNQILVLAELERRYRGGVREWFLPDLHAIARSVVSNADSARTAVVGLVNGKYFSVAGERYALHWPPSV